MAGYIKDGHNEAELRRLAKGYGNYQYTKQNKLRELNFNKEYEMEEENKFWVTIWKICALAFVACVVSIAGCTYGQSNQVKQLILSGKDPILSMCAIHGTEGGRSAHCASALLVSK